MILETLNSSSLGTDGGVAISISSNARGQRHVGLIHSSQNYGELKTFHLGWHLSLRNEPARIGQFVVKTSIGIRAQVQLAAYCRLIWRMNGERSIPYGFGSPQGVLNDAGVYIPGEEGDGLTCATFVLAVFDAKRIPLVQYLTWPSDRPDDHEWQEMIVEKLAAPSAGASADHIEVARSGIGNIRYRPEEVAAAVTVAPPHAHFDAVRPIAEKILEELVAES